MTPLTLDQIRATIIDATDDMMAALLRDLDWMIEAGCEIALATTAEPELRAALDETTRMLEYLWSATGQRYGSDFPVCDLFNDDDPLVQDIPTVLGKARMALAATPERPAGLDALRPLMEAAAAEEARERARVKRYPKTMWVDTTARADFTAAAEAYVRARLSETA